MTQQYKSADGSIWQTVRDHVSNDLRFDRVGSPDGSHEDDFRPQKLDEVLRSWGALTLYDPEAEKVTAMRQAFENATWFGCKSFILGAGGPEMLLQGLRQAGYDLEKLDD